MAAPLVSRPSMLSIAISAAGYFALQGWVQCCTVAIGSDDDLVAVALRIRLAAQATRSFKKCISMIRFV